MAYMFGAAVALAVLALCLAGLAWMYRRRRAARSLAGKTAEMHTDRCRLRPVVDGQGRRTESYTWECAPDCFSRIRFAPPPGPGQFTGPRTSND